MAKYGGSGRNFAYAVARNNAALRTTPLFKVANTLSNLPGKRLIKSVSGMVAQARWLPIKLRLTGLKLYRATAYAEHL
jgi:hypothetical protein